MNNISIGLATEKDRLELINFFQHYKNNNLIENRVECYMSHNFTIVAKDGDQVVGIVQWYLKEDPKAGVVEFEEFLVIEKYRGQGIGTEIFKFAIESVKEYFKNLEIAPRKIFLFVSNSNEKARKLYEKFGFRNVSSVGTLFDDSELELFYCLSLNE